MKQTTELIPVEEFDIDTLREAFRQGRLYIRTAGTPNVNTREEGIQAILRYVARVENCANEAYRLSIRRIWERILRSPELSDSFFLNRYSNSRGRPNWYRVNATVAALLEMNVYRKQSYSAVQLHLMMEQSTKRNNHYTGMNRYLLNRRELSALFRLLKQ